MFNKLIIKLRGPDKSATRSEAEAFIKGLAALSISIFAALLALNTMISNSNSSKVLNSTISANNYWSWYQAKNIRSVLYNISYEQAEDSKLKDKYKAILDDLEDNPKDGKKAIAAMARQAEKDRDIAKARSPYFTWANTSLQLAIVLSSAAILAVAMPMFYASLGIGAFGATFFLIAYFS